jgi:hypothetical protein
MAMICEEVDERKMLRAARWIGQENRRLLLAILSVVTGRTLAYQYVAMQEEEERLEQHFSRLQRGRGDADDAVSAPEHAAKGLPQVPDAEQCRRMSLNDLLTLAAHRLDFVVDCYEDTAARLEQDDLRTAFHDAASVLFAQKSKILTDLQLMRRHPDYC